MKRDFEHIVVGLGGLGCAAAYWLARRAGPEVLGLEQFELGHDRGESQDHSRIIRLSYHTPAYVELARHAYEAWGAVERESGERLVLRTGGLDFAPRTAAIPLDGYMSSLSAAGVAYEHLDADEIARRWPPIRVTADLHGLYQADAGLVMAARANAAHARLARAHGATLVDRTPVTAIRQVGGEFEVVTEPAAYRCRRLILAAGPWSNRMLAGLGLRLPLIVTKEQVTYFRPRNADAFRPDRFPIWIWMDDPCYYGFPTFGEDGPKVGQDAGGLEVDPDERTFDVDEAAFGRVRAFLDRYMPDALGPVIYTKTCLYTLTPDRDFVVDRLPAHPGAFVVIGAGHAFKFASLIGRTLAELAADGATGVDLAPFRVDRDVLQQADPPRHFMV